RCVFFFFQAEDGIRDRTVTGVQTCALPISARPSFSYLLCWSVLGCRSCRALPETRSPTPSGCSRSRKSDHSRPRRRSWPSQIPRSEERRVGKRGNLGGGSHA